MRSDSSTTSAFDVLDALYKRLEGEGEMLTAMTSPDAYQRQRLRGKAEGVWLAMSFVDEAMALARAAQVDDR